MPHEKRKNARANPEQNPSESEVAGISGEKQGATPAGCCLPPSTWRWGMLWFWMSHCGKVNQLPDLNCRTDNCGQSMHVRENPLFSVVCKLKCKLEVVDRFLGEVKVAKGS